MRIAIDLDGVLIRSAGIPFKAEKAEPAIDPSFLKSLEAQGHEIVVYTARPLEDADEIYKVIGMLFDKPVKVYFGKPLADVYIDDNAFNVPLLYSLANTEWRDAVAVSGGPDSLIAYKMTEERYGEAVPYHVSLIHVKGGMAGELERRAVKNIYGKHVRIFDYISAWGLLEEDDHEIPFRNLLIAMVGTFYGNRIWLAFQAGETSNRSHDRSREFTVMASMLLTYLTGKPIRVDSPVWDMTKFDMYQWYVDKGFSVELLKKTVSCYRPIMIGERQLKHCGLCKACVRRAMAEWYVGIFDPDDYIHDPRTSPAARRYAEALGQGKYKGRRAEQMREVLREWGYDV